MSLVTYLSWVEQIERVDGLLEHFHELDRVFSEFLIEVFALPNTDTMFSGTCNLIRYNTLLRMRESYKFRQERWLCGPTGLQLHARSCLRPRCGITA